MNASVGVKKILLDILDFLRYQIENDRCTMSEMQSLADVIMEHSEIDASAEDLSKHYGQKMSTVRCALSRTYFGDKKPKRRVLYNFAMFLRNMPRGWRKKQ